MAILNVKRAELPTSDCIPKGPYALLVTAVQLDSDGGLKEDKNGNKFFGLQFQVVGPENVGRTVFDNYIVTNGARFRQFLDASTVEGDVTDTSQMVGAQVSAYVDIEKIEKNEQYGEQNRIKHYIVKGK